MCMALVFLAVCYKGCVSLQFVDFLCQCTMLSVHQKSGTWTNPKAKKKRRNDAFKNGIAASW